jgi:proteasome lid subunit RPN8/RPN11
MMRFRKDRTKTQGLEPKPTDSATPVKPAEPVSLLATERIFLRDAANAPKPVRREFPGPRNADAALRVAIERRAYADLIAHAKASLEAEVCGVLAGEICEDAQGIFVHVETVIRGSAATEASTHVTFTQATWNAIHKTLEQDFPKLRIVGWYHTHPGFGVEFSDMDLFIQKNFFSGPAQIALVTDPLNGAVAICVNTSLGARYLPRFWVDGREQHGLIPSRDHHMPDASNADPGPAASNLAFQNLEARVSQLVLALDEQRASYYRFLLFCGTVFCLAVIATAGYFIYTAHTSKLEPPRLNAYVPVPIQIGDKTVLVGVGVMEWNVPDELNALLLQVESLKKIAAEKEAREAAAKAGANSSTNSNAATNSPSEPSRAH